MHVLLVCVRIAMKSHSADGAAYTLTRLEHVNAEGGGASAMQDVTEGALPLTDEVFARNCAVIVGLRIQSASCCARRPVA